MPTPLVNSEKYIERFKREAQAAARLHHTNIVGVFGVGEGDGYHYYVMDLVDGQTLSEVIHGLNHSGPGHSTQDNFETRIDLTKTPDLTNADTIVTGESSRFSVSSQPSLDSPPAIAGKTTPPKFNSKHFRWSARIGANIADALTYAHDSNILHRDIKPSNIILDRKGIVWITDFGLAKDSSSEINLTKTGDVIGTPQYLAPESLEGKYDRRSEVYCLGLTLYELATLQPAYPNGTTAEVIRAIATSSPVSPRKLNSKIPIDLSTIIDKAIARDPNSRYQSAEELQHDLLAFVDDRPISARPPSTFENIVKWGRRNPLAAALSAVSALLLILVAVSASIGYLYTMDALNREASKSAKLEVQTSKLEEQIEATEIQQRAAVKASNEAQDFAQKMTDQFNRAEANVEITIAAFDEMFKQVVARGASTTGDLDIDGFEELQGIETSMTKQDAEFLDKFLVFYDKFATQNADNESLKIESARAFRRVANIYQLLGEAQRSIDAYKKSINIYEQAMATSPDSKDELISLVQTKNELSRAFRRTQNWQDIQRAIEENESAIALLEDVPVEQLDNELKLELAKTFNSIGSGSAIISVMYNSALSSRERPPGSMIAQRGPGGRPLPGWIQAYLNPMGRGPGGFEPDGRGPGEPGRGPGEARGQDGRGTGGRGSDGRGPEGRGGGGRGNGGRGPENRDGTGRPPNGRRHGREMESGGNRKLGRLTNHYSNEAIKILDALIVEEPANVEYRSVRANCYCSLASALIEPDPRQARVMRERAIEELESLIEQDPENSSYRYRLAMAFSLGNAANSSKTELKMLDKSVEIANELKEQFPKVLDYHYLYGSVRNKQAGQLIKGGELEAALESVKMAKTTFEYVTKLSPTDRTYRTTQFVLAMQLRALITASENANNIVVTRSAKEMLYQLRPGSGMRPPRRGPIN
jgi:serine/threonine protein kinase